MDQRLEVIEELAAAVKAAGVKFFLAFQRRFDAHFQRARRAVLEGAIGTPLKLHLVARDPAPPPVSYLKQSGGLFLDMASHDFDMARFLVGADIEEISATACACDPEIAAVGDVDQASCTLKFANGVIGVIDNSRTSASGYDQRAEVFGSKGSAFVENVVPNTLRSTHREGSSRDAPFSFFMDRYAEAYVAEMQAFVDVVLNDKPVPCGMEDGRLTVLYAAAARLSLKEKRTVAVAELTQAPRA